MKIIIDCRIASLRIMQKKGLEFKNATDCGTESYDSLCSTIASEDLVNPNPII